MRYTEHLKNAARLVNAKMGMMNERNRLLEEIRENEQKIAGIENEYREAVDAAIEGAKSDKT